MPPVGHLVRCVLLGVLIRGSVASLFVVDQLIPTFKTLGDRGCLPADIDFSDTELAASGCSDKVRAPGLPAECAGAPVAALFYNCYTRSRGLLNAAATMFDRNTTIKNFLIRSNDKEWNVAALRIFDACNQEASKRLTAPQRGVYTLLCLKWSLFANCDERQEMEYRLDAVGARRRALFLSGNCPLSPSTFQDLLELITGSSFAKCGKESNTDYASNDTHKPYQAEISRFVCLLRNFTNYNGYIDESRLMTDIIEQLTRYPEGIQLLTKKIVPCSKRYAPSPVTPEDFVKCGASVGIFSCIYQQANQVASQFPDGCAISADVFEPYG